jgi:hypothetical protein
VIVTAFVLIVGFGFDHRLGGSGISDLTRATDGLLVFLLAYAAIQFLITVVTLSQVGHKYIVKLKDRARPQ